MEKDIRLRAQTLKNMDAAIRSVSDEENGIFETWIALYIPDDTKEDEWEEWARDEELYKNCCEFFSRNIANLIAYGEYNDDGYCLEFFNSEAFWKGRKKDETC